VKPQLEVKGGRELRRALKSVEGGLEDLKTLHGAAATVVVQAAGSTVPRRTGRLAGSIRGSGTKTMAVVRAGGARIPYGGPIHWGWPARNIAPQPFLTEAAQNTEDSWEAIYADGVQRLIDTSIGQNALT